MKKVSNSRNQQGLGLTRLFLIIGALVITIGGVLVWQKRTLPSPTPTPAPSSPSETRRIPPENIPTIKDVGQFCGLEGLKKLSLRQFPVIWIDKCGPLYRLFRECCDAPDIILDENLNLLLCVEVLVGTPMSAENLFLPTLINA